MDNEVYNMLKSLKESFDMHKVEFWLRDGSVLGLVRENDLIEWDTDVDIGIWSKDYSMLITIGWEMRNRGYDTHLDHNSLNIIGKDFNIDIATHYLEGDYACDDYREPKGAFGSFLNLLIWITSQRSEYKEGKIPDHWIKVFIKLVKKIPLRDKINFFLGNIYYSIGVLEYKKKVPSKFFKELKSVKLKGMSLKIPKASEEYLVFRYGPDWRTPKRTSALESLNEGDVLG